MRGGERASADLTVPSAAASPDRLAKLVGGPTAVEQRDGVAFGKELPRGRCAGE